MYGTNLQDIIIELDKLVDYAIDKKTITKNDIDQLVIKRSESIIFELTDNLGKKRIEKAIDVLNNLLDSKEPIQKILVMLYNHFKKLYIVKLSDKNDVKENLNLKPNQTFLIGKYQDQASRFSEKEIRTILEELISLDENFKLGNIDLNVGLESILCIYFY